MDFLKELNDKQLIAATQIEGPVLIIAGAGSGKTKTITARIANMISHGINPRNILAVTFTNKAAGEMKERTQKLLQSVVSHQLSVNSHPFVGTFHSFCVRFLREELRPAKNNLGAATLDKTSSNISNEANSNFIIYDTDDQSSLIKEAMKELEVDEKQFKPSNILSAISNAKNEMLSAEEYGKRAEGYYQETVAKIFKKYEDALISCNSLDFDDLLVKTVKILDTNPEVLEKWQERYKYITIDEYQDTNFAQYKIVNLLAQKYKNLCVVGDDQQSIYSFRGADFRNILNFEKDYPDAKVVLLEENYRSTKNILDAANKVISKNTVKKDKNLWTKKGEGALINSILASNESQEGNFVANEIKRLAREGESKISQACIMYRTNAQSRAVEEALIKNKIPYQLIGGLKFYERREVKDILAYLRIIFNPYDLVSIQRIINVPTRGVGKYEKIYGQIVSRILTETNNKPEVLNADQEIDTTDYGGPTSIVDNDSLFTDIQTSDQKSENYNLQSKFKSFGVKDKKIAILKSFADLIKEIKSESEGKNLSTLLKNIIQKIGYEKYLEAEYVDFENRVENIQEIFSVASVYDSLPQNEAIKSLLENAALSSDADNINENSEKVHLMTVHASKGLEFDTVFVIGLEEGIFPHSRSSLNPGELEEERRLCYVALTRAKKHLYLMFAMRRKLFGSILANSPSRFLFDIPQELVSFRQLEDDSDGLIKIDYDY